MTIRGATPTLAQRIAAKIIRCEGSYCLQWTGSTRRGRDGAERPAIRLGGRGSRMATVARVLLALQDGVPLHRRKGLEACHRCAHYWCVNVDHLCWQTRIENELDKEVWDEHYD